MSPPSTNVTGDGREALAEGGGGRVAPLRIHDYTLTHMATGLAARNVRELRERVASAPDGSLFHHFWGRLLRSDAEPGEYGNDLAEWAIRHLNDPVLAERLALVDPVRVRDSESLRERVAEILEERMEEMEGHAPETRSEDAFHFLSDQMVIYDSGPDVDRPADLLDVVPRLSDASLFLHFVGPLGLHVPDELAVGPWLRRFGPEHAKLADRLESLDVFLMGPGELRERLMEVLRAHLSDRTDH